MDRLVNLNRRDSQQKMQDYSRTSEIRPPGRGIATFVRRPVAAHSPIREEKTRPLCDVGKGILSWARFGNPNHGREETSNQPEQLLYWTATEDVHAHVHHMTGYASSEAKRKRRKDGVLARPASPTLAQCIQQECEKG